MSRCKEFYEKWERAPNWCEKCPDAVRLIDNYIALTKELEDRGVPKETTMVGLTERAARPLLKEKDPIIKEKAIEKIRTDLIGKQTDGRGSLGRGHKKKLTTDDVKKIIKNVKTETQHPVQLPNISERYSLFTGDIETISQQILPESVDVIITDPPYSQEYLPVYEKLAVAASRILKPNGSLLVMVGQSYLPDIIGLLSRHLNYHWMVAYLTPGGQSAQLWQRKVNTFWKPVLWFVKGKYDLDWVGDVVTSKVNDNDKRFHEWGQSESGIAGLVERFSKVGDVVLDPFLGGGTTGYVALKLNRKFIGIDINPESIELTKNRIRSLGETSHA